MAYSADLEKRIDAVTADWGLGKKKMFSGLSYFIDDKICFAVRGDELMIRVDAARASELQVRPGVRQAMMGQRAMKNWLQASGEVIATEPALHELLTIGRDCALNLTD